MLGVYIPKSTLAEICDECNVAVYRVQSGGKEVLADCERAGAIRPKMKLGGAGFLHECKHKAETA